MSTPLLDPIATTAWDRQKARHLLNRAGFGLDTARLDKLIALSPDQAVDEFVSFDKYEEKIAPPPFLVEIKGRKEFNTENPGASEDEIRKLYNEYQRAEREAIQQLKAWWLSRMFVSNRPLQEKLTLFWHGHFATSAQKVKSSWHTFDLNQTFREHAAGNLKALTIKVGQSPSMLTYLDNRRSTKQKPNENWARELMELFTMGIGTYTESDIKNSARAFTGWTADKYKFVYKENTHDFGEKTFLGRTGDFDGWNVIDIIFDQPATAEFMSRKLWSFFAYEDPEPELVKGLADTMRASNYELRPVLTQMFLSNAFYGERAMARQIKSPAQVLVQMCADLGVANPPYPVMARMGRELGQDLFFPPNVKGWDGNRAWINANWLLIRYNLPVQLANANPNQRPKAMMSDPAMTSEMAMKPEKNAAPAKWTPAMTLAGAQFTTAGGCVDFLVDRFLSVPISPDQRGVLLKALGAESEETPLTRDAVGAPELQAALRLLLSCAEYQVC
ncbi:MAG: hypothetical protein AMXMBFR84_20060 [Candidatus Hydrogenedentota bacterium]